MLDVYRTAAERAEQRAEYERRYGQYEEIPQPQVTGISLRVVVDLEGRETEAPMDDWVEVGVYAQNGEPLYLQKHCIGAGKQTITVTVSRKPDRAGIDPRHLLNDWEMGDNGASLKPRDEGFP